jgi:hypothetical protein
MAENCTKELEISHNSQHHLHFTAKLNDTAAAKMERITMSEEEQKSGSKFSETVVTILSVIAGIAFAKIAGLLGLVAAAGGWVVYQYSKAKAGMFLGVLIGIGAALAIYGLAAVALIDLLK